MIPVAAWLLTIPVAVVFKIVDIIGQAGQLTQADSK